MVWLKVVQGESKLKKILITGANSYIGTSFEKWMEQYGDEYSIDTIDLKDETWRKKSFTGYDVCFHVAGIAHSDVGKASEETKALYYKINRDLTIETAKKAKTEGIKQFIFMSSIIVYGDSAPIGKKKVITRDTKPAPANFYGDSKLQAEQGIKGLQDDNFNVVILRPPMIYGKGSRGNYQVLAKMAKKLPLFPDIENERSMLYIDNLCEFLRLVILNEEKGIFFPQNAEYVRTSEMVREISRVHGKDIKLIRIFNPIISLFGKVSTMKIGILVNKAFGSIVYDKKMSNEGGGKYQSYSFIDTIVSTEKN